MKSRITIDVDTDNQPVIRIEYVDSEDVRDKLVKRFLQSFGGSSTWALFYYIVNDISIIRPIPPSELNKEVDSIKKAVEDYNNSCILRGVPFVG